MISGIITETTELATVCRIEEFTEQLRTEIRDKLATICHGEDKVEAGSIIASYKETLKLFLTIYSNKSEETRKGMIGELLSHLLILKACPNYQSANPYFNMEEASIKKGFDLVVFDQSCGEMKIVEVKSGGAGSKSANTANKALLNTAKNDLKSRLNDEKVHVWLNAINGARNALSGGNVKNKINDILEGCYMEASVGAPDSKSKNVVLVSVLYRSCADPITIEDTKKKAEEMAAEGLFQETTVFSIQKETWKQIAAFLKEEAGV